MLISPQPTAHVAERSLFFNMKSVPYSRGQKAAIIKQMVKISRWKYDWTYRWCQLEDFPCVHPSMHHSRLVDVVRLTSASNKPTKANACNPNVTYPPNEWT